MTAWIGVQWEEIVLLCPVNKHLNLFEIPQAIQAQYRSYTILIKTYFLRIRLLMTTLKLLRQINVQQIYKIN